jgi:hypothetical protein
MSIIIIIVIVAIITIIFIFFLIVILNPHHSPSLEIRFLIVSPVLSFPIPHRHLSVLLTSSLCTSTSYFHAPSSSSLLRTKVANREQRDEDLEMRLG